MYLAQLRYIGEARTTWIQMNWPDRTNLGASGPNKMRRTPIFHPLEWFCFICIFHRWNHSTFGHLHVLSDYVTFTYLIWVKWSNSHWKKRNGNDGWIWWMIMEVVDDIEDVNKTTMRILVTRIMMSSVTKVVRLDQGGRSCAGARVGVGDGHR